MSQNLWATIMPFWPVTNILLAQKKKFVPAVGSPSFQALSRDCSRYEINGCAAEIAKTPQCIYCYQMKPEFTCYNLFDNLDAIG
jgi:hypothetical protein